MDQGAVCENVRRRRKQKGTNVQLQLQDARTHKTHIILFKFVLTVDSLESGGCLREEEESIDYCRLWPIRGAKGEEEEEENEGLELLRLETKKKKAKKKKGRIEGGRRSSSW
jgi:hypothetical protein